MHVAHMSVGAAKRRALNTAIDDDHNLAKRPCPLPTCLDPRALHDSTYACTSDHFHPYFAKQKLLTPTKCAEKDDHYTQTDDPNDPDNGTPCMPDNCPDSCTSCLPATDCLTKHAVPCSGGADCRAQNACENPECLGEPCFEQCSETVCSEVACPDNQCDPISCPESPCPQGELCDLPPETFSWLTPACLHTLPGSNLPHSFNYPSNTSAVTGDTFSDVSDWQNLTHNHDLCSNASQFMCQSHGGLHDATSDGMQMFDPHALNFPSKQPYGMMDMLAYGQDFSATKQDAGCLGSFMMQYLSNHNHTYPQHTHDHQANFVCNHSDGTAHVFSYPTCSVHFPFISHFGRSASEPVRDLSISVHQSFHQPSQLQHINHSYSNLRPSISTPQSPYNISSSLQADMRSAEMPLSPISIEQQQCAMTTNSSLPDHNLSSSGSWTSPSGPDSSLQSDNFGDMDADAEINSKQKKLYICQWDVSDGNGNISQPCSHACQSASELQQHVSEQHIKQQNATFDCLWIGCTSKTSDFKQRSKLSRHMLVHTEYLPYPCEWKGCTKRFTTAQQMRNHLNTHTKAKPYACTVPGCTYKTSTPTGLKTHINSVHNKDKRHKCNFPGCDFASTDSSNLSKHKKKHYMRPFKCPHPGCTSNPECRWENLKRHMMTSNHCPELLSDPNALQQYKEECLVAMEQHK